MMKVDIHPSDANVYGALSWSSSNEDVITVNQNGVIFTHNPGTATIKVTAPNGVSVQTTLQVNA